MGIQRFDCAAREVYSEELGEYVRFTDHEAEVARLRAELADAHAAIESRAGWEWKKEADRLRAEAAAQAVDLGQFRDLIGFAALAATNLPETDPRRDFIRQANEFVKLIDSGVAGK